MARRGLPEINAGSMADIAFLLLIFFLVTTTMDVDKGLLRKLPPPVDEPQNEDIKIKQRNILEILINANDQLLVESDYIQVTQLREKAKEFIVNPRDREDMPEKEAKDITGVGNVMVSKQVVSLQNDRGTSYGMYIKVQNELIAAYNEVRDEESKKRFGKVFKDLNEDQQKIIKEIYPQRISEAEPKNIGTK
ncbi:MAG: biopolymer transporter ExbD [Flavobacteriales bacterium]|nr:biopolymer transporter ExbD [Flavobacteriales bacterium]